LNRLQKRLEEKTRRAVEILQEVYPRELVERAYSGEDVSFTRVVDFFNAYPELRDRFNRNGMNQRGGRGYQGMTFPQAVNNLYPELRRNKDEHTLHELITGVVDLNGGGYLRRIKKWCLSEINKGEEVSPYSLQRGDWRERMLFYALRRAAQKYNLEHETRYTTRIFMGDVLNLPKHTFMRGKYMNGGKNDDGERDGKDMNYVLGEMGELFVALLMKWTRILDPKGDFFQNGFANHFSPLRNVYVGGAKERLRTYSYNSDGKLINGSELRPDLRIDTQKNSIAGEVKTGTNYMSKTAFLELARNHAHRKKRMVWCDGKPANNLDEVLHHEIVDGSVVFMLRDEKSYSRDAAGIIRDNGIDFIPGGLFSEYLERLVGAFNGELAGKVLGLMQPVLCEPENLLKIYKDMLMKPHMMQHPGKGEMAEWAFEVLNGAIGHADDIVRIHEAVSKSRRVG